jgi:hypothetical protein
MTYDEMFKAIEEAKQTISIAETQAHNMAKFLVGRLRMVNRAGYWGEHDTLCKLKRELRDFNITTRRWKDRS